MKRILLLPLACLTAHAYSQNVGVDVPTPNEKLHIDGRLRLNTSTLGDPTGGAGVIRWNGSDFQWWNGSTWQSLTSVTETDPVFTASPAGGITAGNITNWNTAFGWGNHASAGYLTTLNGLTGATQTFASGTAGTAPAFNSTGTTHTLNIPMAATAGVTGGLLSNAQYTTLLNGLVGAGTLNQTLRHNGTNWVPSGALVNDGSNIGIGAATPVTRLDVAGSGYATVGTGNRNVARFAQSTGSSGGGIEVVGRRSTGVTSSFIDFKNIDGAEYLMGRVAGMNGNDGERGNLTFWTNNSTIIGTPDLVERMRISNTGAVTIGNLGGGGGRYVRTDNNGNLSATATVPWTHITDPPAFITSYTETDPTWSGAANTTGAVSRTGNVGIGATPPSAILGIGAASGVALSVTGGASGALLGRFERTAGSGGTVSIASSGNYVGVNMTNAANASDYSLAVNGTTFRIMSGYFSSGTDRLTVNSAGNVGIGISDGGQRLDVADNIRASGELISTNANQARFVRGDYGLIHRNDGANYYMLYTASGDQYGSWNTLRPFRINNASGDVFLGNNSLTVLHGGNVGVAATNPQATLDVGGTGAMKMPVGTTAQRPGTAVTGMIRYNTTFGRPEYYDGSNWRLFDSRKEAIGTGGTVTNVGGFRIHRFNSSGTFNVTYAGTVEVLVVAGGGGGSGSDWGGGGGGGGGVIYHSAFFVNEGGVTVTVGAGGGQSAAGGHSFFGALQAFGGGAANTSQTTSTRNGGSGGGAGHMNPSGLASASIQTNNNGGTGYGSNGGASQYWSPFWHGSGGGAGGAGCPGCAGGAGVAFDISGTLTYYGGGGGQCNNSGSWTNGGTGGGGAGRNGSTGINGTANTGGGGGGARLGAGGSGGSGVVIVRYPIPD